MSDASPGWHERQLQRVGALPARRVTWGLVLVFALWVFLDVFVLKLTGGLAQSTFDAMVRARVWVAAPDPRIVIVDIDEASLARMGKEFGRWPWPRDTLATVLAHIESQQPAAVVWDILFSDADRMSPGGDAAFNEAAKQSKHSHFSVVRLPQANDASSQITQAVLPGLWLASVAQSVGPVATVALIPPALPEVASSRLGFNNGYVDADGVLRRYRYLAPLSDGSALKSLPLSVLGAIDKEAASAYLLRSRGQLEPKDELIAWRRHAGDYPHVSFADVFALAEGGKPLAAVPSFSGKVVIIGATAPSLHDIHPTPLSNMQAGVDSLATVLDNLLNQRHMAELPQWLQALLAVGLCIGLAFWVQFKSVSSLAPALLALPVALLGLSYLSLNGLPVFLDLHLAAGLGLIFLAVLRFWNTLRRAHWCTPPSPLTPGLAIWPWMRSDAWLDGDLDRLIDVVEQHAPDCRLVVCDASVTWPGTLRWPELARGMALVGPMASLQVARLAMAPDVRRLASRAGEPTLLNGSADRDSLVQRIYVAWSALQMTNAR